jgi:hypothetical protein
MIKNYHRRTYYLLFTVSFFILWFLFKLGGIPDFMQAIASTLIDVVICFTALLISVEYLLPKYVYRSRYYKFFMAFVILVLISGSLIILAQLALMGTSVFSYRKMVAKYQNHYFYWFWSDLVFGSYFLIAFIATTGCSIRLAFDRVVAGRKVETLEREKIQAELNTLKDQINPHFLFNALNTIYYQIDKSNVAARKTLEQFSSLLRYQLYECDPKEVPVELEAQFLLNYIAVQQQRFDGTCNIKCEGLSAVKGFNIPPYILSPLIENCFKHVSRFDVCNNFIHISCHCKNDWFCLETQNSTSDNITHSEGGIGLNNVRRRLALSYPEHNYDLAIEDHDQIFKLLLKLKITWN